MNTVPQVMISSTFFDLKQVRANLASFLERELGYMPLASEWPSFPIDPDTDTIENCRRRVEREADVLVLIIGGRYGFVDSSAAKSVTNLEYLAARAKRIPIYAFVERRVLALAPVWQATKNGDFSGVVDDPRVFEFVHEVRDLHKVWMREFELAGEIVEALRAQFAYLTLQGARLAQRSVDSRESYLLRELSGAPLRIVLEKPRFWEHRLLAESLIQELELRRGMREQKRLGLTFGERENVTVDEFPTWSEIRMAELQRVNESLDRLLNAEVQRAFGPEGEPGDAGLLLFVARSVASLYQEALEWALRVRRVVAENRLQAVIRKMESFPDDILEKIESFGPLVLREVDSIEESLRKGESPLPRSVILETRLRGIEECSRELKLLSRKIGGR
jgi:hypothetical protein